MLVFGRFTRQGLRMNPPLVQPPRGILNPKAAKANFDLAYYPAASALEFFVEHYWILRWDLRGRSPHSQETLPSACVNLAVEPGNSGIVGVTTGKFKCMLSGAGRIFGVKFRPGAFYPFVQTAMTAFTDRHIPLAQVFGADGVALEGDILALEADAALVAHMDAFLRSRLPQPDPMVITINTLIATIIADRSIVKVDDLCVHLAYSKRTIQRLFQQYVGVSPKWVIQRYRLYEAAELLETDSEIDSAHIAANLGYCDQAHFIKDFKLIVGKTPLAYAREVRR